MIFHKTEKARLLLQSHDGSLGLRERRLLILCNGQRNPAELSALFGEDAAATLRQLQSLGLVKADAAASPAKTPAAKPAAAQPATAATPPPPPANPRRSLVAAKMYLLDMLALQRGEEANALRQQVQTSREADAMLEGFTAALRFISSHSAASMAQRVRERLFEVLPEEHLPALRRLDA